MNKIDKEFKGTYFISSISLTTSVVEFGISSIFVIFLLNVLHFSMDLTSETYAHYYSFAYLMPIIIGYISDKYLKEDTCVILGFISMIISQILLFFCSMLYDPQGIVRNNYILNSQNVFYFFGMFFLGIGTSFTGLSFSHIINLINKDENSKEHAFSIYYPILNLGVIIGIIIMTLIVGETNYSSFKWAFLSFGLCLTIGLIIFLLFKNRFLLDGNNTLNFNQIITNLKENLLNRIIELSNSTKNKILKLNLREKQRLFNKSITENEKTRLKLFILILIFILIYRIAYSQSNISILYFIDGYVERDLGFYIMPVELFCILNPLFILILSPIFIKFNEKLEEKNINLGLIDKLIISILLMITCFGVLSVIGFSIDTNMTEKISIIWMILFEIIFAISELFFSIGSYTIVSELAPSNYFSLFFGIFIATRAISTYITGIICTYFPESQDIGYYIGTFKINGLFGFFSIFIILNLIAVIILIIERNKIKQMHLGEPDYQ